ncbi:MAG: hypothetical protein IJ791_08645 [Lachnospiraceae bacterium]|nr:hypothetical protein [Lachnospiraceae bacterium]
MAGQGFATINYYSVTCGICLAFWLFKSIGANYSKTQWIILFFVMFFLLYIANRNGDKRLLITALVLWGLKNVRLGTLAIWMLGIRVFLVGLKMALSGMGIIANPVIETMWKTWLNGKKTFASARAYGYEHPNYTSALLLSIPIIVMLVWDIKAMSRKKRLLLYAVIVGGALSLYSLLVSRTTLYICILLVLLLLLFEVTNGKQRLQRLLCYCLSLAPALGLVSTIIVAYLCFIQNSIGLKVNWWLNSRFTTFLAQSSDFNMGDYLLGCKQAYWGEIGYLVMVQNYGFLFTLCCIVFIMLTSIHYAKDNRYVICVMVFVYSIYFMIEGYAANPMMNVTLLLNGVMFFAYGKEKQQTTYS